MMCRVVLALLVSASLSQAAHGETRPSYHGVLRGSLLSEPSTFDPIAARSHADVNLSVLVFDTLYKNTGTGPVRPHLAARLPVVSADGREVTISLRKGVLFHDKARLTPSIVARSLRRVLARARWLLPPVKGVRSARDAVVLSLRRRTPNIATLLAATGTAITRRGRAPSSRRPIGTGPFKLRWINRGKKRVTLTAWEQHFAGRPYLSQLRLRWYVKDQEALAYETGRSHTSYRGPSPYKGHVPMYRTLNVQGPATLLVYVGFGKRNQAITASRHFRHALSMALSRRAFVYAGKRERVAPCVYPVARDGGGPNLSPTQVGANLGAARASLARAPSTAGANLELIVDSSRLDDKRIAQKVVYALMRLGVSAYISELAPAVFAKRVRSGQTDMYIGQLAPPAASPLLAVAAAFAVGNDPWMRVRWAKVRMTINQTLAAFAKRLPVVPLFHRAVRMHHRSNIRGVGFDSLTMPSLADMYLYGSPRRSRGGR